MRSIVQFLESVYGIPFGPDTRGRCARCGQEVRFNADHPRDDELYAIWVNGRPCSGPGSHKVLYDVYVLPSEEASVAGLSSILEQLQ